MAQETLEEAARSYVENFATSVKSAREIGFIDGAKWQQERMYSEEEVLDLIQSLSMNIEFNSYGSVHVRTARYFLEQYKNKL
jgi:hypothetical protein